MTTPTTQRFVDLFARMDGRTLNGTNAHVHGVRKAAIERFAALGLPTSKDEAWKYTPIAKALEHDYTLDFGADQPELAPEALDHLAVPGLEADRLVLINGRFRPDLSSLGALPEGVVVTGFAEAAEQHPDLIERHFARYADTETDALAALQTAFSLDGAFVYVPQGVTVERPIHVLHLTRAERDTLTLARVLVAAEDDAELTLVETRDSQGTARTFGGLVSEMFVGRHARVQHYLVQREGDAASQVNTLQVYQQAESYFKTHTSTLSGRLVRNTLRFLPDAERCETHLFGLFLGDGEMHVDNHTLVDHAQPNCFSNELFKGILDDRATGVFNGKVFVRRDAQQTNAYQSNKTIVLTENARMYSKPELEIYADDVKCSHGATTGQLDREGLFYLRSRGIPERQARAMLLQAFARDVIDEVEIEPLRVLLEAEVDARFHT